MAKDHQSLKKTPNMKQSNRKKELRGNVSLITPFSKHSAFKVDSGGGRGTGAGAGPEMARLPWEAAQVALAKYHRLGT